MTSIVLKIYQYMSGHKGLCLLLFLAISAFLVLQVTRVTYKEDISDFLESVKNRKFGVCIYTEKLSNKMTHLP